MQGKQTTNLASINKTALSRFPIPLPPIAEQVEILRRIDAETSFIDHIEQSIDTTLEKRDTLRQSILTRACGGQLAAQDPSDARTLERRKTAKERA